MQTVEEKIAELLFKDNKLTIAEIEKKYPKRKLKPGQEVTRFAPSPTGYMHLGNFFQAYISYTVARMSGGVFYLRNEDTDQKRKVENAMEIIFSIMKQYDITPNEYEVKGFETKGAYAPYIQSERTEIYKAYAKKLVAEGKAFPCFCKKTEGLEDVEKKREKKFSVRDNTEKDPCRNLTYEQIEANVKAGKPYSIRLKSKGNGDGRVEFEDVLKGKIEMEENAKDVVLLKSDGLPTYHFAHAVDDTLMGTTLVVRGEEWLPSVPVHIEIFNDLGFDRIKYLHNPLICKKEGNLKRKLSKRKDKEMDMRYYASAGYPKETICEYMMFLINSGFEPWRLKNPTLSYLDYKFEPLNITATSPVFDIDKFNDISKEIIGRMSADEFFEAYRNWAKENDKQLYDFINKKPEYVKAFINIERDKPQPRKDIFNFSMIHNYYNYMFGAPDKYEIDDAERRKFEEVLRTYKKYIDLSDKTAWFDKIKEMASALGYAVDNKAYKQNPEAYKGNVAKVCEYIRIAVTGRRISPDLYSIMTLLGEDKVRERISLIV